MEKETTARIKDLPQEERPREKLANQGPESLTDAELLAIFFRTGSRERSAVELGQSLVERYGDLHKLAGLSLEQLQQVKGIGLAKAAELLAVFEMGRRLALRRAQAACLDTPQAIYQFIAPEVQNLTTESLRILMLNTRLRFIGMEEISHGSISESVAHPREILKPVILHSAYAFILIHNHPSGDPSPSLADRHLTSRLSKASDLLKLTMLDHMIIGIPTENHDGYYSFKEAGLLF